MAQMLVSTSTVGTSLQELLTAEDIQPGDVPSYQLCKTIYVSHPLGAKMAESPIRMAQSQPREIAVPKGPEEKCKEAFEREWRAINADKYILMCATLARVYGIASIACVVEGKSTEAPLDFNDLADANISFNVLDPLNTAGSLVLNLDPNAIDYLKSRDIAVNGKKYHRSRSVVYMNEQPIYLEYTSSSFGYVGRSCYQRALYPLKSFINSMVTDDMVVYKAGLLVAIMKGVGSIVDNIMQRVAGMKRALLQQGGTNNVISIEEGESIETLNMQNLDGAFGMARKNILENIAAADDMPAQMLNSETFAEGFGEGSEDAKKVAAYIDRKREEMHPLYAYFDKIVQYRAWNRQWYKTIQAEFKDEFGSVSYEEAFYRFCNSFTATWPSLLKEPESELVKVDDVKLKATIAIGEVLLPVLDPENKARVLEWICDNFNDRKLLFSSPLNLDMNDFLEYDPMQMQQGAGGEEGEEGGVQPLKEPTPRHPFAASDSDNPRIRRALDELSASVARLPERRRPPQKKAS